MKTLKNILLINGVSSGVTGIGLILFAGFIAEIFEVSVLEPFWGTGLFLVIFASMVIYEALQNPIRRERIRLIISLDVIWVIGSVILVLLNLENISLVGHLLIVAVAFWVALMAYLQSRGLKELSY
ncbi:MAG TPA: hypothetical protein VD908_08835 [Cytophagales bacterium]|nr:hypothetical protein [Cytophagales bacterium]